MKDSSCQGHVLIIEDDPYNGPFAEQLLRAAGFSTDLAVSAEEGFNILERSQDSGPDMILLDVNLPGMDGLEMVGRLKAHSDYQYIPVILCTVHDSLEHKIEGL